MDPLEDAPGDQPEIDPAFYLENNTEFKKLPTKLQALILASPMARNQMATLLRNGLTIEISANMGLYQAEYNPTDNKIILDAATINDEFSSDADYAASIMISTIAHEIGHALAHMNALFPQATTLGEFIETYKLKEAFAILNSMLISSELEGSTGMDVINVGYATDGELTALFNAFAVHKNIDTLLSQYGDLFINAEWPGGTDMDGDGKTSQKDKAISQYNDGYR